MSLTIEQAIKKLLIRDPFYGLFLLGIDKRFDNSIPTACVCRDGINVKLFRTRHVTTRKDSLKNSQISYGLIIDDKVLFTADTQFNRPQLKFLLDKFPKIEVIFHDCDVMGYSRGVHAAYDELVTLPKEIKSKTYLCHYSEAVNTIDALVDGFAGLAKHWVYYDFE